MLRPAKHKRFIKCYRFLAKINNMPSIKRLSQLSYPGVRPLNEDKVLINEQQNIFGVFDGASSLDSYLSSEGKTGAYIAANIAASIFNTEKGDLDKIALVANDNIEAAHKAANIDVSKNLNRFGTTAAVIKIKAGAAQLLQVGDSVIIIIKKNGIAETPLGYFDHDLNIMRKWRKLADKGASDIRGIVADDVIALRESANRAYGMLNGDKKLKDFIKITQTDLDDVATILLLTDGMYIPKADPNQDENWNDYARLYREGGLKKIYNTVRKIEATDPKLIKYPRYKLHDDASGIAIDFM
jgi:serine/threonine protein phosphatase PrpC